MLPESRKFEFGEFLLDTKEKVLLRKSKPVSITPKAFELLRVLVTNHGHLIEKNELIGEVWAESFVEEANLPFTIGLLRKALGDNAQQPHFIETVPKRGYRFVADVRKVRTTALRDTYDSAHSLATSSPPYVLIMISAILVLSLLGLAFVWFRGEKPAPAGKTPDRLTNNGKVTVAAVAADGKTLVFAQKVGSGETLWRRDLATGEELQILPSSAAEFVGMAVSPDSEFIYYSVFTNNAVTSSVSRVALNGGGAPEPLSKIETDVSVSFSPDGKQFAFAESHSAVQETLLRLADADGTNVKTLLTLKGERRVLPVFQASPIAWSPDGAVIACSVQETDGDDTYSRILLVDPVNGSERLLSERRWGSVESIAWKDNENLAITNVEPNTPGTDVFVISRSTGEVAKLNVSSKAYTWLSASNGKLFAVEKETYSSIYTADFLADSVTPQTKQIFNESGVIEEINWPAGDKIFYNSWATGANEIWKINPDGTHPHQVTNGSHLTYGFSVSLAEGRFVFAAARKRTSSLYVADADGQNLKQLTDGPEDFRPRFMPDGKEVIFQRGSLVKPTLWRVPADGDQPPKQVTGYFALQPSISSDGKVIAYQFMDFEGEERVWRLGLMDSLTGKLLNKIDFPNLVTERKTVWRPGDDLLTIGVNVGDGFGFLLMSRTGGVHQTIENVTADKISSFAWSPDGKRLAFSSNQVTSDSVVLD